MSTHRHLYAVVFADGSREGRYRHTCLLGSHKRVEMRWVHEHYVAVAAMHFSDRTTRFQRERFPRQ
jgi:hypothetical protein